MRIGIDCHNLEGRRTGTGRYLMNLLKYWVNENAEFILYFKNQIPDDISESNNFQKKILKSNSPAWPAGGNFWFEHILLPKAMKQDKVNMFFSPHYILPMSVPKGIKTAVAIHDISYEAHPEWYSWQNIFLLKWISKKSAQKANIIFACSEFTKNEILKYYKVNSDKIKVILLAADEKFVPNPLIKKRKLIFYVGAIFNRRFIPQTIEAFEKIKNRLPDYKLLIAGPNYTQPFTEIKSNDSIKYIDYIKDEDLVSLYDSAELFVWLSTYEGFGLPPLEAMACGTPVLSTKKTSLAEVLGDYPIYVENPENIEEIGGKILKILSDENLRNIMIKKGLEQAQKFFWHKTAEETLNALINYER